MIDTNDNITIVSPWLQAHQAAKFLGISVGTLRNWTSEGRIPHAKRGHFVRYRLEELDRWLREGLRYKLNAKAVDDGPAKKNAATGQEN